MLLGQLRISTWESSGGFDEWCYGNSEFAFGAIPKIKFQLADKYVCSKKENLVIKTKEISSWEEEYFVPSKKDCFAWTTY